MWVENVRPGGQQSDDIAVGDDGGTRLDRELIELLNELRVALPGVQVLFAFLLIVPFSQRFTETTGVQRNAYFVALLAAAASVAFLVTPSAFHRIRFRQGDKAFMLRMANVVTIVGLVGLAVSTVCAIFLVSDFIFTNAASRIATTLLAALFVTMWFVFPAARRWSDVRRERFSSAGGGPEGS